MELTEQYVQIAGEHTEEYSVEVGGGAECHLESCLAATLGFPTWGTNHIPKKGNGLLFICFKFLEMPF